MKFSLLPWIALSGLAAAYPFNSSFASDNEVEKSPQLQPRASPGDFYLRVMPLGASIVYGYTSTDGNGFRKHLRDQLRWAGWDVNMVGTINNGSMKDNNVAATPGYTIDQVNALAKENYQFLPNLVVINAGVNDMGGDYQNAHVRLGNMLDGLFNAIPGTTLIVSTLLPITDATAESHAAVYRANTRAMLATRIAAGQKIVLADMDDGFMTLADIWDGVHPTDAGYFKMTSVWWDAIEKALAKNMITAPADNGFDDAAQAITSLVCLKTLGDTRTELTTQVGSGIDDGSYVHATTNKGLVYSVVAKESQGIFWFAGVLGSGMDDLVQFINTDGAGTTYFAIHQNLGGGNFKLIDGYISTNLACEAGGVRWADMNGDGFDDMLCVGTDGSMSMALNKANASPLPNFAAISVIMPSQGEARSQVLLGDIDGDGRSDYCVVHVAGSTRTLHCWRNGGVGAAPTSSYPGGLWQDLGIVLTDDDTYGLDSGMLVDINGDHRYDWLKMNTQGSVITKTNGRFCVSDPVNYQIGWTDSGNTHAGFNEPGVNVRNFIKFGRIWGSTGYRSYVRVTPTLVSGTVYTYSFNVWLNEGAGGTTRKADGNHYCDMRGKGADDYLWVHVDGTVTVFGNEHAYPSWIHYGDVFKVPNVYDRRAVHFADMDGDGRCDILHVNTVTGATEVFRNDYNAATDTFSFTYLGFQSGSISCTEGMGPGLRDLGVRFADIDGNGKADYLCIEPNGRTTGWLNMGNNVWTSLGQVKLSENFDRANHRFVDINGDGRADFIWIDKFSGDTRVWLNAGMVPVAGSAFTWTDEGYRYAGHSQGHCVHYANIGGLGLADETYAHAVVNNAETWFNTCGKDLSAGGGDDGAITDPQLIAYTSADADGVVAVGVDPGLTLGDLGALPTLDDYNPDDPAVVTYSAGDYFRYQGESGSGFSLNVLYADGPTALPNDIVCDVVAPGVNGNAIGCVGETAEFLLMTALEDGQVQARDLGQAARTTNFTFVPLPDWQARPECSTHCRLHAEAPLNTWVPVGNGTSVHGNPHVVHFMNTGKTAVYTAVRDTASSLAGDAIAHTRRFNEELWKASLVRMDHGDPLYQKPGQGGQYRYFREASTKATMDAAVDGFLKTCQFFLKESGELPSSGPDWFGMVLTPSAAGLNDMISTEDLDRMGSTCGSEEQNLRQYIIWPVEGLKVDRIKAILARFPYANPVEHVSVNGYGTLFWTASLTLAQVELVTSEDQTKEVEAKCTDDCENPSEELIDTLNEVEFIPTNITNGAALLHKVQERDYGIISQGNAVPELSFVSNPPGGFRSDYYYDGSAAEGVALYILDGSVFQTTLSDFGLVQDSLGHTIRDKAAIYNIGPEGWSPPLNATGQDHGTGMLQQAVGGLYGVAKKATPITYTFDYTDTRAWIIVALDEMEADWRAKRSSGPYGTLGVLSMSFGYIPDPYGGVAFEESFASSLNRLSSLGVMPICSAGNEGVVSYKYPAKFGDSNDPFHVPDLLVIGAVDNTGTQTSFSNYGDWVQLFAPGEDVQASYFNPLMGGVWENIYTISGTSRAAAKTAGLAAYFLGLSSLRNLIQTAADLRKYMLSSAYARDYVRSIYNNVS